MTKNRIVTGRNTDSGKTSFYKKSIIFSRCKSACQKTQNILHIWQNSIKLFGAFDLFVLYRRIMKNNAIGLNIEVNGGFAPQLTKLISFAK